MNLREALIDARDRISDPAHWCQGFAAVDENGMEVASWHRSAVRWCAIGTCNRSVFDGHQYFISTQLACDAEAALKAASMRLFGRKHVEDVNDHDGHAAVMAIYDYAIQHVV